MQYFDFQVIIDCKFAALNVPRIVGVSIMAVGEDGTIVVVSVKRKSHWLLMVRVEETALKKSLRVDLLCRLQPHRQL